jgi:exopolysaccharide biosynthesis predicted pyruvyltransferase EpsI
METKMLAFQSFETNQAILGLINKLIIYIKLKSKNIDPKISDREIKNAKEKVIEFLKKLDTSLENRLHSNILYGMDERNRMLVRNFLEAKSKAKKFKSPLFKQSPSGVIKLLEKPNFYIEASLVDSLSDLRTLIEEHLTVDIKELIGDI